MSTPTTFHLLRPEDLPRQRGEFLADEPTRVALEPLIELLIRAPDEQVLEAAHHALGRLGLDPYKLARVEDDPSESFESHANDQSFRIVRVHGQGPRVAAHSTLTSLVLLLEDARQGGTELDPERWSRLRHAFATILGVLAGAAEGSPPAASIALGAPAGTGERDALQRWMRGHYAFMAIVQGLVMVLHAFEEAFAADDPVASRRALAGATSIMWGTESALRFAGDFVYADYEKAVRPTLMPPIAPPGMTGLHWRDHRYMVSQLARMRGQFSHLAPALRRDLNELHRATAAAYESHKYVCASFVGNERPSLLMSSRSEKTAIETLDHFKTVRLGLLDRSRQ
jgi:hypothetical protein